MNPLASIDVGPMDLDVLVGAITLPVDTDSLFVRMRQTGGSSPWLFSYGLLSWRTANGRDLGTVKAYPHIEGELYRLGVGLSPVERTGGLYFTPRSYNLNWIKAGERLQLSFEWEAAAIGAGGPGGGSFDAARSFVANGAGLELIRVVFP